MLKIAMDITLKAFLMFLLWATASGLIWCAAPANTAIEKCALYTAIFSSVLMLIAANALLIMISVSVPFIS